MHRYANTIISFLFPPLCLHCRREGVWLCPAAQEEIESLTVLKNPLSIDCVDRVICRGEYDAPVLGTIIQKVKYDFLTAPAEIFPSLLEPLRFELNGVAKDTVIVPIPLHWRRRLSRGFNQSELIAKALSSTTGIPVMNLLQRHRATTPQVKLNSQDRITNVVGAFRGRPVAKMPREVILVDDVITTGSTIKECAAVLRAAGVQKISAVALAKG